MGIEETKRSRPGHNPQVDANGVIWNETVHQKGLDDFYRSDTDNVSALAQWMGKSLEKEFFWVVHENERCYSSSMEQTCRQVRIWSCELASRLTFRAGTFFFRNSKRVLVSQTPRSDGHYDYQWHTKNGKKIPTLTIRLVRLQTSKTHLYRTNRSRAVTSTGMYPGVVRIWA